MQLADALRKRLDVGMAVAVAVRLVVSEVVRMAEKRVRGALALVVQCAERGFERARAPAQIRDLAMQMLRYSDDSAAMR
jgi:hypothetical protein